MKDSMNKIRIKVNDVVIVTAGTDRGRRGKVLLVDRDRGKIIVEGVNKKKKSMRPSQDNPKGGFLQIERPIRISNVMYFCEKCKKGVRIGVSASESSKSRVCAKCGKGL